MGPSGPARVLLVHPGVYDHPSARLYPPWGALCVSDALRLRGIEVRVRDFNGLEIEGALGHELKEFAPTILGVTAKLGHSARRMRQVVDCARSMTPSIRIAAGGPLVASFPSPKMKLWSGIDALFWGDGEDAFGHWIHVKQIASQLIGPLEAADLDRVGIPTWWDELQEYVQPAQSWPGMGRCGLHISVGRGCTGRCGFCYLRTQYPTGRLRMLSVCRLMRDLRRLERRLGTMGFYFTDDCIVDRPRQWILSFCTALRGIGSPYRLGCSLRLDELQDRALLSRMYSAGFRSFYVGVEAASHEVRRRLGKGPVKQDVATVLRCARELGFFLRASIGIGWPGETAAEMEDTLRLLDSLPWLVFDAYRYKRLPGTACGSARSVGATRDRDDEDMTESAFEDYSVFGRNYSELDDDVVETAWNELLRRRDYRYERILGGWPY